MPRSPGYSDAHTVRAFPRADPDAVLEARQHGGAGGKILCVDSVFPYLYRRTTRGIFPVDGPVGAGPHQHPYAGAGLRFDLAPAKDDDDSFNGPSSVHQPDDDAVADATDDRLLLIHASQRPVAVLDSIQPYWNRNPVFHNRVATDLPVVPQDGAGTGRRAVFVDPI